MQKLTYRWNLSDTHFAKDAGKVFSTFSGGGGSSMGYKLAGFDVLGCCEIDPRMLAMYRENLRPKYAYLESIEDFRHREDLPDELFDLDILDGSPPCTSFSVAGLREKTWGQKKKFREGQEEQVLDRLFFEFIALAEKLRPKVWIAENVPGILKGNAKKYVREIYIHAKRTGYHLQHFTLSGANMGLPQMRKRVFFVALRNDLKRFVPLRNDLFTANPVLNLDFDESPVPFSKIYCPDCERPGLSDYMRDLWEQRKPTDKHFGQIKKRLTGRVFV